MWTSFYDQPLVLKSDQLHLWSLNKTVHTNRLSEYWDLLNEVEREKATKFRFEKDRNCSIISRGILRSLLGNYLNVAPKSIKFNFGAYGKPFLKEASDIEFNISHSGDVIVLGFVKKGNIGVDVEYTKRNIEVKKIAEQFFSKEEIVSLFSLDASYHKQAFYNCWTRKESFIKALGSGLSFPLDQFVVSLDNTEKAQLITTKWDAKEKENWVLKSFEPEENYIGAFSVKRNVTAIQYWRYQ